MDIVIAVTLGKKIDDKEKGRLNLQFTKANYGVINFGLLGLSLKIKSSVRCYTKQTSTTGKHTHTPRRMASQQIATGSGN